MHKNIPVRLSVICLGLFIFQSSHAESSSQEVHQLDTIVLQAFHLDKDILSTPASIFYVEQPFVQNNMNVNLSETLKGVPGLQVNNRENYAQDLQMSMRGFGARSTFGIRGIRLYVDGIPATMPDGQGQTSNIDLNSLSHIEILGGAFSSLYGNSSGGTILTTTRKGEGQDSIRLDYAGGSHQKGQANLILQGGTTNSSEPSYIISSSYFDTHGFRDHSTAQKKLNNSKLTWNLENGSEVNWIINHVDIQADDPGGLTRAAWKENSKQVANNVQLYNARKKIEQTQTGVTWNKPLDDQNELYSMLYLGQRSVTQYQSIPKMSQLASNHSGGVIDFERHYFGLDLRWINQEAIEKTRFIFGLAFDAMKEDRKGFQNFSGDILGVKGQLRREEHNTLWNLDPYMQISYNFLPNWTLDAGLRYSNVHFKSKDYYLDNGDNSGTTEYKRLLPSLALQWEIQPELMTYVSYTQGFETPTFTEMSYPANEDDSYKFNLKAAKSETFETGLKSKNDLGLFTLALFSTQTKNDIVSAGNNEGRATFRNADKTLRQGFEFSWNKNIWQDLIAQASYSYIHAKFNSNIPAIFYDTLQPNKMNYAEKAILVPAIPNGNYIPGIAKNHAFLGLAWQPEQGVHAGIDVRYSDKIYVNDLNTDTAPSYVVTSANLGYNWILKDWTVNTFARVDNLFNQNYIGSVIVNESNARYFEPADGRNWSMGLSIEKRF
ncbi:TonB-dependent receptor [Acinetobacter equi]|uniref:TonB-dependent receptor n=1 Tax=Acinetobacter equi TaxID=1324350 RepID=A0A0N9VRY0_9GAMM|nr:TonB-dependent receptor [Acinetobacter equi]ALH96110.1 TonB-dependent receptor [Acinetobacter equi]